MNKLEELCDKQSCCKDCPLLIKRVVVADDTYDYHETNICYLKEFKKIKKIESFIHETFRQEIENRVIEFMKDGLSKEEAMKVIRKLIKENEEHL